MDKLLWTYAVVANMVELSDVAGVVAAAVPVNVGLLIGAYIVDISVPFTEKKLVALILVALILSADMEPATCSIVFGLVVPIPTFPSVVIRSRSYIWKSPMGAVQNVRSDQRLFSIAIIAVVGNGLLIGFRSGDK